MDGRAPPARPGRPILPQRGVFGRRQHGCRLDECLVHGYLGPPVSSRFVRDLLLEGQPEQDANAVTPVLCPRGGLDVSAVIVRYAERDDVDLAIVQSDTRGGGAARLITPLFDEALHVLVAADLGGPSPRLKSIPNVRVGSGRMVTTQSMMHRRS